MATSSDWEVWITVLHPSQMASRKKVLLKVRSYNASDRLVAKNSQVIILGDSGVGKTSLMNQYVWQDYGAATSDDSALITY